MRNSHLLFCFILAAATGGTAAHGPAEARYLGNEGVMVAHGDTRILFDAFYAESFGGQYTLVPNATEQTMLEARAPYDGIDAIFVTHIHPDHFNSRKMIAYLRAHPTVRLYAGLDVIGAIHAADVSADDPISKQLVTIHVARGEPPKTISIEGLVIEAFPIPHAGNGPMPHYAYRVTLDQATTVMHLGDADAAENHYTPYQVVLQSKTTDAAFVPTWILSSASGRRVLQQIIKPVQAIGIHVEDKHRASAAKFRKELDADAFVDPGETRVIMGKQ